MNKNNYINAINQLKISEEFQTETAKRMKKAALEKPMKPLLMRRASYAFAGVALMVAVGAFALNSAGLLQSPNGIEDDSHNSITVPKVSLPSASGEVNARMRPLFVYQGRVYIRYNTDIVTADGYTVSNEVLEQLRGEYLGTTLGGIDEMSGTGAYEADFASNIGESDIYTVKGYDSKYRLMAYTEYEGGFSCEIYESFGGLVLNSGEDYLGILKLKGNIASYQWEGIESWNNGGMQRFDAADNALLDGFIEALYAAKPVEETMDLLIEDMSGDNQKFVYLKTEDNLIVTLRLLKDGYVYAPEVGFFQVDKEGFSAFYESMQLQ